MDMEMNAKGHIVTKTIDRRTGVMIGLLALIIVVVGVVLCVYFVTRESENSKCTKECCGEHCLPGSGLNADDVFEVRNIREYYIQAEKVVWNYAPAGENLVNQNDGFFNDTLVNRGNRVGSVYSKYMYKLYTSGSYSDQIIQPVSQGFVGPTLRVEVGEILRVHFRNNADIPLSVHPHGVRYDKGNEGSVQVDGTSGSLKSDDRVPAGRSFTYTWKLDSNFAPAEGDPNCVPFGYHSHVDASKEINAGLVGILLVCKAGALNKAGVRHDVDKEIVLYFDSIDEGKSWLLDENLERCQNTSECKRLLENGDPDFEESLKKDSINGYVFGNMPGLDVCVGEKVAWYIFSLEAELHPVNIFGQTFIRQHHRSSVVGIWSATFREAEMIADQPGRWMIQCMNSEHNRNHIQLAWKCYQAPTKVYMNVQTCPKYSSKDNLSGNVRRYYLSAETEMWNYASSGLNMYDGGNITEENSKSEKYFSKLYNGKLAIGGEYKKSRFIQYNDTAFETKVPADVHLGILGPVIRAEVGDVIEIELINATPYPVSITLQGTSFDASQNGMWLKNSSDGSMEGHVVTTGKSVMYRFSVPLSAAPVDNDLSCLTYMYYSTVDMERDVSSGLVGPLLICKPGTLDPNTGLQKNVDKELFLYFSSINENHSWYIDENIADNIGTGGVNKDDEDFTESNIMRSINGRAYGNLEGLDMCVGDTVSWHVFSFGDTEGLHGVKWNGNNVMIDGVYRDSHVTISGSTFTAMMHPTSTGNWSVICHNNYHYDAGMTAMYHVNTCGRTNTTVLPVIGVTRRYYIAAVERKWNFSPKTILPFSGENFTDPSSDQHFRVQKDGKFIGSSYTMALFREFTDDTFTQEVTMTDATEHLGVLGPFIRAAVGDTIEVVFKNKASRPYSMHAQGLKYSKSNEGWKYKDGLPDTKGDEIQPGDEFTYHWEVPESSGPAKGGPNCVNFMYHSAVDPVKDTYSGLAGPIVVCRRGVITKDGKRNDGVEREFALLFQAFDENQSWYLQQNIKEFCPNADTSTADFEESNKYDSINGLIYNNIKGLVANQGDNIAWYIMALGENEDMHTAHFHGHTYIYRTRQAQEGDVLEVFPGTYETAMMFASNPGNWLIHCHVGQHAIDGMVASYTVLDT